MHWVVQLLLVMWLFDSSDKLSSIGQALKDIRLELKKRKG